MLSGVVLFRLNGLWLIEFYGVNGRLPYTQAVVCETQRYSSIVTTIFHAAVADSSNIPDVLCCFH